MTTEEGDPGDLGRLSVSGGNFWACVSGGAGSQRTGTERGIGHLRVRGLERAELAGSGRDVKPVDVSVEAHLLRPEQIPLEWRRCLRTGEKDRGVHLLFGDHEHRRVRRAWKGKKGPAPREDTRGREVGQLESRKAPREPFLLRAQSQGKSLRRQAEQHKFPEPAMLCDQVRPPLGLSPPGTRPLPFPGERLVQAPSALL